MMDQIASLMARGLISADASQGLVQQVNDIRNKPEPFAIPLEGSGGRGVAGGASGKTTVAPLSPAEHLNGLKDAGTDQGRFKEAFERLSNDKSVKSDDLREIVKDYDAGIVRGKTRADHLEQIQRAFVRNARFENKLK